MITGFLFAYALCTSVLIGLGIMRARKNRKEKSLKSQPVNYTTGLENTIKEVFKKAGLEGEIHTIPNTPEEAIVIMQETLAKAIKGSELEILHWLKYLGRTLDDNKRDVGALMQATSAITKAMVEIRGIAEKFGKPMPPEVNVESFVHQLEYVRDKFATTVPQKRAVAAIINNVKTSYGTK